MIMLDFLHIEIAIVSFMETWVELVERNEWTDKLVKAGSSDPRGCGRPGRRRDFQQIYKTRLRNQVWSKRYTSTSDVAGSTPGSSTSNIAGGSMATGNAYKHFTLIGKGEKEIQKFNARGKTVIFKFKDVDTEVNSITSLQQAFNEVLQLTADGPYKLYANEKTQMEKINQLTSFANHLTHRYSSDLETIIANINNTGQILTNLSNTVDIRFLLQNEIYQTRQLLKTLQIIERTISLAWRDVPNLELIQVSELIQIQKHLQKSYNPDQLLKLDKIHLFKILESSKLIIVSTEKAITCLLKIPIVKPFIANYSRIYPLPNYQDIIIVPPKKYYLITSQNTYWTDEECKNLQENTLCTQKLQLQENCTLNHLNNCMTSRIANEYHLSIPLQNHQILTANKKEEEIIEECSGQITRTLIKGTNLINSLCKIVIGAAIYSNTVPKTEISIPMIEPLTFETTKQIHLHLRHLEDPKDLRSEVRELVQEPIHLKPITHLVHYSFSFVYLIIFTALITIVIKFRHRIYSLITKRIVRIRSRNAKPECEMQTLHQPLYPPLSVDAQI
ncbi:hypothetical protein FQR65_LT03804 [Abscondita terminalis]|nr:hypothetical protein FQR65_LT03804 [Abscondita terminalis]